MPTEPQPPTLSEAERKNILDAADHLLDRDIIATVERILAARHEQATQEADRRVAEVVVVVDGVLMGIPGPAIVCNTPRDRDEQWRKAIRAALAPFRSEVTGGGDG